MMIKWGTFWCAGDVTGIWNVPEPFFRDWQLARGTEIGTKLIALTLNLYKLPIAFRQQHFTSKTQRPTICVHYITAISLPPHSDASMTNTFPPAGPFLLCQSSPSEFFFVERPKPSTTLHMTVHKFSTYPWKQDDITLLSKGLPFSPIPHIPLKEYSFDILRQYGNYAHTLRLCCKQRSQLPPQTIYPQSIFFTTTSLFPNSSIIPSNTPLITSRPSFPFVSTIPQTHEILSPKIHIYTTPIGILWTTTTWGLYWRNRNLFKPSPLCHT